MNRHTHPRRHPAASPEPLRVRVELLERTRDFLNELLLPLILEERSAGPCGVLRDGSLRVGLF